MIASKLMPVVQLALILTLSVAPTLLGAPGEARAATDWQISVIEEGRAFADVSMAVDSDGNVHLAYGGGQLYYAVYNNATWSSQRLEKLEGGTGYDCSLALDSSGNPAIAYVASVFGYKQDLKYARWDGSQWNIEHVASDSGMSEYVSLRFDSSGHPCIAYYSSGVRCVRWNGSAWVADAVDAGSGWYISLAFDAEGNPAISYYDFVNDDLRYAHWDGTQWETETVDSDGEVGEHTSLAFDPDGNPCVSYADSANDLLKYASWDGSGWQIQTIDVDVSSMIHSTSLAFDAGGNPAVAFKEADFRYARWDGTQWLAQTVEAAALLSFGGSCTMAFDPVGQPVMGYYAYGGVERNSAVKCARLDGAKWNTETVDTRAGVGLYSSVAIDSQGHPAIGYSDDLNDEVRYANWDGTQWSIDTVDGQGGSYSSLAFDATGNPAMAYLQSDSWFADADLKYAHRDGSAWQVETIDTGSDLRHTSLAFDGDGNPGISYNDWENGALKYAHWDGLSWQIQTVDSGVRVGEDCSLAFDLLGRPGISYRGSGLIKYAHWDGSAWVIETVDADAGDGLSTSLAFDPYGRPGIGYARNYPSEAIRYARWNGSDWVVQYVSNPADIVGWDYTSLAFDPSGNPAIAHGRDELLFARFDGSQWDVEAVDEAASVGSYCSLAFDPNGNAIIGYYDSTNGDLKYASLSPNTPPDQPTNVAPSNGATGVSLTPTLQSSAFSDPDSADTHAASQWQVTTTQGDYSSPVFDSGVDASNLTSIAVPSGTLGYGTTYYWRVRHRDSQGNWSEWSDETSFTTGDPVVSFPDASLEAAIREAIGKPVGDIHASDLSALTVLDATERGIADLSGLEHCTGLTDLRLGDNQIADISPLADLTGLTDLELWSNSIVDISPLANLTSLTELALEFNDISDISPLSNLTSLNGLNLSTNQISDISPLADLSQLTDLDINCNQITDISALSGLTNLSGLSFLGNRVEDISPLANLTGLTKLWMKDNRAANISPLEGLTALTQLGLAGNGIGDISPLSDLTALTYLDLSRNQVSDVSPLANLTGLTELWLGVNQIVDVSPLANLTGLTDLGLGANTIDDISPLANLTSLGQIHLEFNNIDDISPLSNLTGLAELYLSENQIGDISSLSDLAGLKRLDLDSNQIADISALSGLTELRALYLDDNRIVDVTPLSGLTRLGDIEPHYECPEAQGGPIHLSLRNNRVANVGPLTENEGLDEGDGIDLRDNPLSAESLISFIPGLQERGVHVVYMPNEAPNQPVNAFPKNGASGLSLTPTLQSSAFSDPDSGDSHAASQWQITTKAGDYSDPVFESSEDASNLTSIGVPSGTLTPGVTYFWQVRHKDSRSEWSAWSEETSFKTEVTVQQTIGSSGGRIETPDQDIIIQIPEGALSDDTQVELRVWQPEDRPSPPSGFSFGNTFFTIEGLTTLAKEVTITFKYSDADLDAAGGDPQRLALSRWDSDAGVWVTLPTTVDTAARTLTVTADRLSLWAVLVKDPTLWSRIQLWLLWGGIPFLAVLLLVCNRWLNWRGRMDRDLKRWEGKGYDLSDWKDRLGKK